MLVDMRVIAVIPARYPSTRFPGKPLALLGGKPMIQWVYEAARSSAIFDEVVVATDDGRIRDAVLEFGGKVEMTDPAHVSGTERMAEVASRIDGDIFVNVQGDEPFIEKETLYAVVRLVVQGGFEIGSAIAPLTDFADLDNRNIVKAIADKNGRAIYFSRFPIPYSRETATGALVPSRHIGIYAYRRDALLKLAKLPVSALERGESLEQLRALENGIAIGLARVESTSFGIDTPEDLARAEARVNS